MVVTQCVDNITNKTVTEDLCDANTKPTELSAPCNENKCPARYDTSDTSDTIPFTSRKPRKS